MAASRRSTLARFMAQSLQAHNRTAVDAAAYYSDRERCRSEVFAPAGKAAMVAFPPPAPAEQQLAITLYDLAGAEAARRFSPFCWRTKMALAHKGLEVETVPWRFTEKDKLPQPNGGRVPVIVDGGQVVHDSSAIADYLETRYTDRPALFGDEAARALTRFVQNWTETVLQPGLVGFVVLDICRHAAPQDQAYFPQSREERFGTTLEEVVKDREARLPAFRESLT